MNNVFLRESCLGSLRVTKNNQLSRLASSANKLRLLYGWGQRPRYIFSRQRFAA